MHQTGVVLGEEVMVNPAVIDQHNVDAWMLKGYMTLLNFYDNMPVLNSNSQQACIDSLAEIDKVIGLLRAGTASTFQTPEAALSRILPLLTRSVMYLVAYASEPMDNYNLTQLHSIREKLQHHASRKPS